jgi:tripartite-type tricarboxylate transporter receptor subunit TctC
VDRYGKFFPKNFEDLLHLKSDKSPRDTSMVFTFPLRRRAIVGCLVALATTGLSYAQGVAYPSRLVKIIVPYAAGGPNDLMARILAQRLTVSTGQTFIVDNKPGAGGVIGTDAVAKAAPDGYTIGFISAPFTMAPALQAKMPYNTLSDLAPVTKVAESPMVLMVPSTSPYKSLKELIAEAKKAPEKLTYGSGGVGSTPHLTTELLSSVTGAKFMHVPYKGGGESIKALMSGEVDLLIDSVTSTAGAIASGKVKPLAVSQSKRSDRLPNVPTFEEAGVPNFSMTHWVGIVAPAKTPSNVLGILHAQIVKALQDPEVVQRLHDLGAAPVGDSPEAFKSFIAEEMGKWRQTVKAADIKPQ